MKMLKLFLFLTMFIASLALLVCPVGAIPVSFSSTNGHLSASVTFDTDSTGNLIVTLTNDSTADVLAPEDVLTAVFFNIEGDPELAGYSALLNEGSEVHVGSVVLFDDDVSAQWAYKNGLSGVLPSGANYGISSTGLNIFGPHDMFGEEEGDPNGLGYGITSEGDNPLTGNQKVTGGNKNVIVPLIQNSVVFTLGLPDDFDLKEVNLDDVIGNVTFNYGTELNTPVPEPATLLLLGTGLIGLAGFKRKEFFEKR